MIASKEKEEDVKAKLLLFFLLQQPDSSQMVDLNSSNRTL